jgi:virginiamycin B lyase
MSLHRLKWLLILFPIALSLSVHAQTSPDQTPLAKGKLLADQLCNSCHVLAGRTGAGYTSDGWSKVLRMMRNTGLAYTPEQEALLHQYLLTTYPERAKPAAVIVAGDVRIKLQAWQVPTPGSRPHDPLATSDGMLWYTGQLSNKMGYVNPKTGVFKEYTVNTPLSGPHGLVEDKNGMVWYTGNGGALIGKIDPKTGANTEYPMKDKSVTDPHTLIFDQQGILWFTAQVSNRIGRMDTQTGEVKVLTSPTANSRPYGMAVNSKGVVYYVAFGTNKIGAIDPKTLVITEYTLPHAASRPRRITVTSDDIIWYADFSRGFLGRLDAATGKVTEYPSPSGARSQPYGVIWYSESGSKPNTVVRFDPKTEKFQSWAIPGGGDIVRNTSVTKDGGFVLANSLTNEVTLVTVEK